MTLVDTHAHLDFPDFAGDLEATVQRAADAGVSRIVTIGTDLESSGRAVGLARRFPAVRAAAGWHPSHAAEAPDDIRSELASLARQPEIAAIGETGLDYTRLPVGVEGERLKLKQRRLFEQHLEVAAAAQLNCVIHQRDSFQDVLAIMRPYVGKLRAVFHCFVDSPAAMEQIISLGFLVSFTGIITFKNGENVRQTVAATPLEKLMVETDCPYLAPAPNRGKRCEPAYVRHTAEAIARVKNLTREAVAQATTETASKFFRF